MSETTLEGLYSVIEESAGLLDVTSSRDAVWPILTAYEDQVPEAVIAFRLATGERTTGDLDCRFIMLPKDVNPYGIAVSNGLTAKTDHPVGTLLSDIHEQCPIDCYGIDFGVVNGFKKTWSFFPVDDLQELSKLADIPSMPRSLSENMDFYTRHGLDDKASLVGIDYPSKTVNIYFLNAPAECREPETIRGMLREFGLPEPSDQMLSLAQQAFGIYTTLTWDSSKIERITFSVVTPNLADLPARLEPSIENFVRNAPCKYDPDDRSFIYAATSWAGGEYYKLQSYYQWRRQLLDLLAAHADA